MHHDDPFKPEPAKQLAVLWTKAQPAVRAFIFSLTRDREAADDLLQEVAVTVVEKFAELKSHEAFVAWALSIARFKAMNYQAAVKRDRMVFDDEAVEHLAAAHERIAPLASEHRIALAHCIERLNDREREVIDRKYAQNQSGAEIALALGIETNNVYALLHRIRQTLLRCIRRRLELRGDA